MIFLKFLNAISSNRKVHQQRNLGVNDKQDIIHLNGDAIALGQSIATIIKRV